MKHGLSHALLQAHTVGGDHVAAANAERVAGEPPVRLIAYYLPQFHPIPENDEWWGPGFTEWTNVTRGTPRFEGHHQPLLPADLGFYDLRMPETLRQQAELAKRYGIQGFCIHYYWFSGRRLLERPLSILRANQDIDMPFCICWANENWTRRWDGLDQEVLVAQQHEPQNDIAFIRDLMPVLRDPRYIRVDGKPLIVVYRPHLLPDPLATARRWRAELAEAGIGEPFLAMVQGFGHHDPRPIGFDAAVEFPPHKVGFDEARRLRVKRFETSFAGTVIDYGDMVRQSLAQPVAPYRHYYGVSPRWDNEARRPGRGTTFAGATPAAYQEWLTAICRRTVTEKPQDDRLVFVNSWNEWAEGAPLEPDRRYGHAFLSATAAALNAVAGVRPEPVPAARSAPIPKPRRVARREGPPHLPIIAHDAHFHGAQMLSLNLARSFVQHGLATTELMLGSGGELEAAMAAVAPTRRIGSGFSDTAAWQAEAKRLAEAGVGTVLCNSLVSGRAVPALRAAGLSTVVMVHELPKLIADYKLEETARQVASQSDVVVFPNAAVRDPFLAAFGPVAGRVVVRGQGLYREPMPPERRAAARAATRARLGIGDHETLVLGLGFGDRRKGLDLWPAIATAVRDASQHVRFIWVGALELTLRPEVEAAVRRAGLQNAVLFPGRTDVPEDFIVASDIFLLSSREDPFPSAAMEAAAHGLPVVCFEGGGGMAAFCRETGLRPARMEDVKSAANAVLDLVADEALRAAAGSAGARIIAARYGFREYAEALVSIAKPPAPAVTAVVPNFNYARYLKPRIESILRQTRPVAEIIVLDDASTDDSLSVLEALRDASPVPIRIVANAVNSGSVSHQWARGMELATTPLVWIAEADDLAEQTFLERLLDAFDDPGVVMAYAQSKMIDADGAVTAPDYLGYTDDVDPVLWRADYTRSGQEEIAGALAIKNTIPNVSAVLFRRDAALPVLRAELDEMVALRNAADWLFYIRLLQTGRVAFRAESLNLHRRHAGGVTISSAHRQHLDEIARIQATAIRAVPVDARRRAAGRAFLESAAKVFGLPRRDAAEAAAIRDLMADDRAWFEAVCARAEGARQPDVPPALLPGFPPAELQISTTSQAGRATLREAFQFYLDCRDGFARHGAPMRPGDRLLDFGVAWGRIGRFFLRDIGPANLVGLDVEASSIELSRTLFPEGSFEVCPPRPPSVLPDGSLRFCVAYSVFSHLSEDTCAAWMREFHRILVPGGMVAVTTRGRWFFDYCESKRRDPIAQGYEAELGALFPDIAAARARYDAGELVFATSPGVSGGGSRDTSFYGETFIPEAYAAHAWLPEMELVEFNFDPARQTHPVLFLRRRA